MSTANNSLDPRLYKGDEQEALLYFQERKKEVDRLLWAINVQIGDYIATCEGCNRKVTEIDLRYFEIELEDENENEESDENEEPKFTTLETLMLGEVRFTDTNGRWHHFPGGGCANPKETPEEVTEYHREWAYDMKYPGRAKQWHGDNTESLNKAIKYWSSMREAFEAKLPIVDKFGELLPEFDNNWLAG